MTFTFLMCINKETPFFIDAIESMLNQDYEQYYGICIVANDCTEDLWETLQKIEAQNKQVMSLYRTKIGQLSYNLNYGAERISSDYIVRMDADDVSMPNRLSKTRKIIEESNYPDVAGASAIIINEDGKVIGKSSAAISEKSLKRLIKFKNPLVHPACAIKTTVLIEEKGYMGGVHGQDNELWLRMIRNGRRIIRSDEIILEYRINSFQSKGSRIAYAEGASLRFREFLLTWHPAYLLGAFARTFYILFCKVKVALKFK